MIVGVVGCGSIGLRHIRNLRLLEVDEVIATDPDEARLEMSRSLGAVAYDQLDRLLAAGPDAVVVCVPPALHHTIGLRVLTAGVDLLVEKPIAVTLEGADVLISEALRQERILQVGYNLRFHPCVKRMRDLVHDRSIGRVMAVRAEFGQYLPDWRPGRDYRTGYNASAALGGGILLDASHEIDYLRWILGDFSTVSALVGRVGDLEIDAEDIACLLLRTADDVVVEIHLDSLQRTYVRQCKLIGTEGSATWDYAHGLFVESPGLRLDLMAAPDPNKMYVEELRSFLRHVDQRSQPLVDGYAGRRALAVALAAKRAAVERREIEL